MDKTEKVLKTIEVMTIILKNNDEFKKYLEIAKLSLNEKQIDLINEVMKILSHENSKTSSIANIIDVMVDVFEDGKIKLIEMPKLLNILFKNIKIKNLKEINNEDLEIILKIIILILNETKVIKIDENEFDLIFESIDSSVFIFDQFEEININVTNNSPDLVVDSTNQSNNNIINNDSDDDDDVNKNKGFTIKCFYLNFKF